MQLMQQAQADVTIVAVMGRLDSQTAPHFGDCLNETLRTGQAHVLVEASQLNYIGSVGFRTLLVAAKQAAGQGGWLALCSLTAPMRQMLELSGLEAAFPTYHSLDEALERLAAQ